MRRFAGGGSIARDPLAAHWRGAAQSALDIYNGPYFYVYSADYSGGLGGPSIPVPQYPPAGRQYPSISPPNFRGLVLGCIEAAFCN